MVYRINCGRKIDAKPRWYTSRPPYYLRFVLPSGLHTETEAFYVSPWSDLPLHPFTNTGSLARVAYSLRVCLVGVVSHQPGLVA